MLCEFSCRKRRILNLFANLHGSHFVSNFRSKYHTIDSVIFNENLRLKPSAFATEVHHVTGEGLDGGVIYSEILARKDDANRFSILNALYKDSGHASYTGGALKNLRENTTNQLVGLFDARLNCVTF